jgi:hypothetical protein
LIWVLHDNHLGHDRVAEESTAVRFERQSDGIVDVIFILEDEALKLGCVIVEDSP